MKVILIRSRAIDPNVLKIARCLANNNFKLKVLLWDRTGKNKDTHINDIEICYFKMKAPYDKITAAFYLPFWWIYESFFLFRNSDSNTIIHACDLDTLWPAIFVKTLKRIRMNYTIYDFYADNISQTIPLIFRDFIAFIEKNGLQFAHTVFLVDESRLSQIEGSKYKNVVYVYNTPENLSIHNHHGLQIDQNEFIIFYAGVLHESRGLFQIVQAVESLKNVKLIVAGVGPERYLFEKGDPMQNKKIQYIGWIPYEEVLMHTLDSDCIIALYNPDILNNRYASPNKLFEAMMCGKPIIVNEGTTMTKIVKNEKCGRIISYSNISQLKDAIDSLRQDKQLCQSLGKNGRNAYEKRYDWAIMQKRLIAAYETSRT